ncbi:MAG: DPP IV N-terminal domain-containing protein, partial [Planctomycetaceae bacterium]|nr:DPP IV N-terminal domain-containing protein [Planctomycetaceae bacterium]
MHWKRRRARATFVQVIAVILLGGTSLNADTNDWAKIAEPRLRSIYELEEFRERPFEAEWLLDSSGYVVNQRDEQSDQTQRIEYDVRSGEQRSIKVSEAPEGILSPDGSHVLRFRGRDLIVRELATGNIVQLTEKPEERDLFFRDPQWSPNGQRVLFVESDETDVRLRPTLDPTDPSYPTVRQRRFARVGETIARLRIGVVGRDGGAIQWLPVDVPEEGCYFGQVDWAENSEEVIVETLSRFRNQREFLLVHVETGTIQRLYYETNDAWAVGSQGINSGVTWIRDGEAFIVISEKDGWRHAFLHSRNGDQIALLTPGDYDLIDRGGVDDERGWFYFYASPDNGTQKYLYRVPLDGAGTLERITPEDQPGTHDYQFSPDTRWAFHTYSTFDRPPVVDLVELPDHMSHRVLEANEELQERARKWITHPTEFFELPIGEGVSCDAWMLKPKDFDEARTYPIFVYVYGEPYAQTVLDRWGAAQSHFLRVVADLGYLVVSIDNRGTPAPKGAAWRRSIFGSLGPLSTEDQAAALQELGRSRSYVDLNRVGIWGWSGGGSNTLNAMFRKPELYHVGIAVVPKPQPHLYNAWFQEIYMRTRDVNREGYEQSVPINFAEGLDGKLLIITGSGETNTHIDIIEGLVDRL